MKKYILFPLLALFSNTGLSQWTWQNPFPQGNDVSAVQFFSADTGYILGTKGPFLKTTDGGETWDNYCTDVIGTNNTTFTNMQFLNKDIGYLIGYATVVKTVDGGNNWFYVMDEYPQVLFYEMQFFDELTGYVGGMAYNTQKSIIYKTTDGGENWTAYDCPSYFSVSGMSFINPDTGWIAQSDGIFRTDNGCQDWYLVLDTGYPFFAVFFLDRIHGWARSGWNNEFYRTTDGGESWTLSYIGSDFEYNEIYFINPYTGWMVGYEDYDKRVRKSVDGGQSWTVCLNYPSTLTDLSVVDENTIWTVGQGAAIFKSLDGGMNWDTIHYGPRDKINKILFSDQDTQTGWVAGENGLLMKTSNGGEEWDIVPLGVQIELKDIQFLDENIGYLTGYGNAFYKTVNAGNTWMSYPVDPGLDITALYFTDPDTGWVVTLGGKIYKTEDGASTWQLASLINSWDLNDVWFTDTHHGTIAGQESAGEWGGYLSTIDGGLTWETHYVSPLQSIDFINEYNGWMTGESDDGGFLLVTEDGGASWTKKNDILYYHGLYVEMITVDIGIGVGDYGFVAYTTDAGTSWNYLLNVTNADLKGCYSRDLSDIRIIGEGGVIYRSCIDTSSYIIPGVTSELLPALTIYPNPVKNCSLISCKITPKSNVTIDIFDQYGRLVEHDLDKHNLQEDYRYRWCRKNLSSGIYLVRVCAGKEIFSGKLLLL